MNLGSQVQPSSRVVFISGGYQSGGAGVLARNEIVTFINDTLTCPAPPDLPTGNSRGVTARTSNGHPLVCGGETTLTSCLEYVPERRTWIEGPELLHDRDNAASTELSDGIFWFVSGNSRHI